MCCSQFLVLKITFKMMTFFKQKNRELDTDSPNATECSHLVSVISVLQRNKEEDGNPV